MGTSTSKLSDIAISKAPFKLGNNPWHGWELEEQGSEQYDARNTHIATYQKGTPGVITEYRSNGDLCLVVDGKEFTLTPKQALQWDVKKPIPHHLWD